MFFAVLPIILCLHRNIRYTIVAIVDFDDLTTIVFKVSNVVQKRFNEEKQSLDLMEKGQVNKAREMDPNDLIANLLKSTGLSCDDLLSKLQQYKSTQSETDEQTSESCQNEENSQDDQQYDSNNSVILETKSSSVDLDDVGKSEPDTRSKTNNNGDNDSVLSTEKNEEKSDKEDTVLTEIKNAINELEKQNVTEEVTTVIDHSYSNPTVSVEAQDHSESSVDEFQKPQSPLDVDHEGTENLPKSEDSLRNILRMQLSSLRNMKKSSGYLPDLQNKSMFFHNLKKKRKSCDNPVRTVTTEKEEEDKPGTSNENSILSSSDCTDFVNVAGDVDVAEEKEERRFAAITDACNEEKSSVVDEKSSPSKEIKNILTNYRRKMSLNYFDAKRYKLTVRKEDRSPLSVKKTISGNFSEDPGIKKSVKNSEKSPFVSDSLDDFLNESSQLKVSYDIPKLGAEEGISENTKSPYDDVNRTPKIDTISEDTNQKEKPKLVKAKTLAERRRQFEKLKAQEKPTTSTPIKKLKAPKELEIREVPKKVASNRNSYILYNNKKLFTTGKIKDQCLASITCNITKQNPPKKTTPTNPYKKPSLLSSLTQNKSCRVKYKPGPLCKKAILQNVESRDKWTTELKTLPKIFLEVAPEVNKPIDRKVAHLLPVFDDTLITEDRADFALSVLIPQKETKSFKFHIPYTNKQEKMVVRKPSKPVVRPIVCEKEETDIASDVSKILDDIITYVEVKEIAPTLLKYDDTAQEPCEETIGNSVKTKTRKIKRKKLDLELLRLNCKVIDVGTNEEEDKDCVKSYCRLGCICKSLLCENVFSNHCQLVECMFGCTCPPVTSKKVITSNSLSVHTVNHLEDKLKKNLAKEEREFTQTLIHTDDDTIFLGTGKMRRSTKPPKKYTDYVGEDVVIEESYSVPQTKTLELKKCTVLLEKLDLFDIEPYCFYHHRHNCHCGGKTVDVVPAKKLKIQDQIPKIRIVKTKEDQHKAWYDSCARIRKVFAEYKVRNKDPLYNERLRIKNLGKRKYENTEKVVDDTPIEPGRIEPVVPKKPSKRKQTFNVREDVILKPTRKEFALQRRKQKLKPKVYKQESNIFDGEIKVSLKDNQEMLSIIGEEYSSLGFLRILPWTKLIENFQKRKISIWSKESRPSVLLLNSAGHFPPKNFVDIRNTTQMSDVIKWILTDVLPPERPRDLMHVILRPNKDHYSIAGYCLKTIEESQKDASEQLNNGTSESSESSPVLPIGTSQISVCPKSNESESIEETAVTSSIDVVNIDDNDTILKPAIQENANSKPKQESVLLTKLLNGARKKLLIPTSVEVAPNPTAKQKQELIKLVTKKPYTKVLSTTRQFQQVSASQLKIMSGGKAIPVKVVRNPQEIIKLASLCLEVKSESAPSIVCESESRDPKKIMKLASLCREVVQSESAPPVICEPESGTFEPVLSQGTDVLPKLTAVASDKICVVSKAILSRKCGHKDMHNRNKALILTSKEFTKHKLFLSTETDGGDITVPLPKLANNYKWRMIYLNSDFSFLNFVRPNYSIKYTDLMDVVKMAANTKMTITLRNKEFCDCYSHPLFGIFCVPDYQDRLFIGPYLPKELHSIETLRYLQGRLIDTQIFNKMLGRKVEKIPTWIHELTRPTLPSGLLIDITEDEYREIIDLDSDSEERPETDSLLCQPFVEELTAEDLKLKNNINRYIVTNIPHLGYFGACQRDSKAIEVFWPGGTTGYRFPNVTFAKNLLIQYLSQIFCPIPHDFKINVIIMTHLDLDTNRPVATKYFKNDGPYFCGEFGILEKTVPDNILEKYQVPSIELLLKSHQDTERREYAMTRLFGLFLMTNEELRNHPEPENILQWANSEIYILKKLADNYESEKTDLQNMIRVQTQKIREMRKESRTEDPALTVSETIEITDSDEEEKQSSPPNNTGPASIKISTSGKETQNCDRSLLKPKIWINRRSLLKNNEQLAKKPEPTALNSVNIVHSNVVLKNKMLITKIQ